MLTIRRAARQDAPLLKTLIYEMSVYEKLTANITEETITRDGFGPDPKFEALIADWDQQPVGYALYFSYYSSFQGLGLYLEDLYVRPPFRNKGVGKALFVKVAAEAMQKRCFGIMFSVLSWNQPAIEFYRRLNATFLDDWKTVCLQGDALQSLAHTVR